MVDEELNASLRKIAKGAGIGFTGTMIGMALGYISRVVIAKWLGASDYGLVALGFAVMQIAGTISLLGLSQGVIRHVSFYKGKRDFSKIKGTILDAVKISLPVSVFISTILFLEAGWISENVFHGEKLRDVLKVFSIAVPFWVLGQIFVSSTVGFQDLRYRAYVGSIFQNVFRLCAIVVLLFIGFGVIGAALGWVLAIVLTPPLIFYFLYKRVFTEFFKVKATSIKRELFFFSYPLIFASFAGLVLMWTDTLMLGYFSTAAEVGIYNAASSTSRWLQYILSPFVIIFLPVMTELYSKNELEALKNMYTTVTKWVISIIFPLFLVMLLFSKWVLKFTFGSEFTSGDTTLAILACGFLTFGIAGLSYRALQAYGKTKLVMVSDFLSAGTNFILNLYLIPLYGATGAAIATTSSLGLRSVLGLLFVKKFVKIYPFKVAHLKPLAASFLAFPLLYFLARYAVNLSLFLLVIVLPAYIFTYAFMLLIMKFFEKEDLVVMRAIEQRAGIRIEWLRKIIVKLL